MKNLKKFIFGILFINFPIYGFILYNKSDHIICITHVASNETTEIPSTGDIKGIELNDSFRGHLFKITNKETKKSHQTNFLHILPGCIAVIRI